MLEVSGSRFKLNAHSKLYCMGKVPIFDDGIWHLATVELNDVILIGNSAGMFFFFSFYNIICKSVIHT